MGQLRDKKGRCVTRFLIIIMIIVLVYTQVQYEKNFGGREALVYTHSIEGGSDQSEKAHTSNVLPVIVNSPINSPKLALLLSFPNSGTSYTLKNLRRVSNVSTASNYCGHNREKIPVFPNTSDISGPYIIPGSYPHEFPSHFILTKTHCFHCIQCHPSEYLISVHTFKDRCMRTCIQTYQKTPFGFVEEKVYDRYPISVVGKFVHLVRNPFDNIVSRFRLHKKQLLRERSHGRKKSFNATEFHEYCKDQDAMFDNEERWTWKHSKVMKNAKRLPCHADWYRLITWHNYAFEMSADHQETIETLVLHYDDYRIDHNGTILNLLKFLSLKRIQSPIEFRWSNYSEFYNEDQRRAAINFVRLIASNDTIEELRRYGF
jgi:hypothetical protein